MTQTTIDPPAKSITIATDTSTVSTDTTTLDTASQSKFSLPPLLIRPPLPRMHHGPTRAAAAAAAIDNRWLDHVQIWTISTDLHLAFDIPYKTEFSKDPFDAYTKRSIAIRGNHDTLGLIMQPSDGTISFPQLETIEKESPAARIPPWRSELRHQYMCTVNDIPIQNISDIESAIKQARDNHELEIQITFAIFTYIPMQPQLGIPYYTMIR